MSTQIIEPLLLALNKLILQVEAILFLKDGLKFNYVLGFEIFEKGGLCQNLIFL